MKHQDVIDEFFIDDSRHIIKDRARKSVLLAIIRDLQFCLGAHRRWKDLELTGIQNSKMKKILPTFATISLYCSSVDLLTRVVKRRWPKTRENKKFFVNCAKRWFHLSRESAEQLWVLRNSVSHQYSLDRKHVVRHFGSPSVVEKTPKGYWVFHLHAMYSNLSKTKEEIYDYLSSQSLSSKRRTAKYLLSNGFFYVPAKF